MAGTAGTLGTSLLSSDIGGTAGAQSPDAADRNLEYSDGASGSVQSPDAADRNVVATDDATGSVQSPDAADRNFTYAAADDDAIGATQSPDAADRNFSTVDGTFGGEPRDIAPVDLGSGYGIPADGGAEATDVHLPH